MNSKCCKCYSSLEGGSTYIEGGMAYSFCKICTDVLETFPTNIMHIYLIPESKQSQADKNIFEARKRRNKGIRLFN
jgi:hypothetical protein